MATDDLIKNYEIKVLLATFTMATRVFAQTSFRKLAESQFLLYVNVIMAKLQTQKWIDIYIGSLPRDI